MPCSWPGSLPERAPRRWPSISAPESAPSASRCRRASAYAAQGVVPLPPPWAAEGLHGRRLRFAHATPEPAARVALVDATAGRAGGLAVMPPLVERGPRGYTSEMEALLARG